MDATLWLPITWCLPKWGRTESIFPRLRKYLLVGGNGIASLYHLAMTKYFLTFFTIILIALTIFFAWTFVNRLTMPFNFEGNYFDENTSVVYHEQSVFVYGLITIFLLLFSALTGFFARKKFKNK